MIRGRAAIIGNGVSGRGSQVAVVTASAAARGVMEGKAFPELTQAAVIRYAPQTATPLHHSPTA